MPADFDSLCALALELVKTQKYNQALVVLDEILILRPHYPEALYYQAKALIALSQLEGALAKLSQAIEINSHFEQALFERGQLHFDCFEYDLAVESFQSFLEASRNNMHPEVQLQRAIIYRDFQRPSDAIFCCDQIIEQVPQHAGAHYLRGICKLLVGNYETGWSDFQSRFKTWGDPSLAHPYQQPEWFGQFDVSSKVVLVWGEQGQGDVFQFARYLTEISKRGGKAIYQAHPAIFDLMKQSFAQTDVRIISKLDLLPEFDCHCSVMSLALACATDSLEKIPRETPYLLANLEDIQIWQKRLHALSNKARLRVGLVWAGGKFESNPSQVKMDAMRSVKLAQMMPALMLANHVAIEFHSLQKGDASQQINALPSDTPKPYDWFEQLEDWTDTAALIANLDLIIAVDTSTAHLAGAMGKPVWLLSRFNGCWRWLLEGERSPWYPSMRVIRQKQLGGWDSVMQELTIALRYWAAARITASPNEANP